MKCKCCGIDYINDLMIGELCSCRNNEVCETNHCYRIGVGDNEPHMCKESKLVKKMTKEEAETRGCSSR